MPAARRPPRWHALFREIVELLESEVMESEQQFRHADERIKKMFTVPVNRAIREGAIPIREAAGPHPFEIEGPIQVSLPLPGSIASTLCLPWRRRSAWKRSPTPPGRSSIRFAVIRSSKGEQDMTAHPARAIPGQSADPEDRRGGEASPPAA